MTEVSFLHELFIHDSIYSNIHTFPTVIPIAQINDEQTNKRILVPRQWCNFLMLKIIVDLKAL